MEIKSNGVRMIVDNAFDSDQELGIEFMGRYNNNGDIFLTRSQVEDLVDHLTEVLEAR